MGLFMRSPFHISGTDGTVPRLSVGSFVFSLKIPFKQSRDKSKKRELRDSIKQEMSKEK